jgi:hypothetical protein
VHLIVSHWTLRHLVDPFGTVKRLYSLLNPKQGKLLSNGFLFNFANNDEIQSFPIGNENILAASNAICLFNKFTAGRDVGQFLLMRTNNNELNIPLEYTGDTVGLGWGYQCESRTVTVFKKGNIEKPAINRIYLVNKIYCMQDDYRAKELFNNLLNQKLFYRINSLKSKL